LAAELSDASQTKKENEKEEVKIKRILVPIDGSNCSVRAAKYAIEVATLQKAQIFCIHVIASLPYGYGVAGCAIDEYFEDAEKQAQSWFNSIIEMAKKNINDVKADIFTDAKSITGAIIDYASSKSIDLVIIGNKRRTGLKRLLLGSLAHGIVQHAHCPVLLVR
jgi:nucleotide-binding universal stress UspA family protein